MKYLNHFALLITGFYLVSCGNEPKKQPVQTTPQQEVYKKASPDFNADSAFYFVQKQVDFGPRVTASAASKKCGDWIIAEFKKYGDHVTEQKAVVTNYVNGKDLPIRNIIAEINPQAKKRILLCAHWDSRPYADKDSHDPDKPIDGANDGASGVAVLLEIARTLKTFPAGVGVDIVLFDAEDLGKNEFRSSYCLGSQYWSKNLHQPNYKADFGILLDMVGAADAVFGWEENSFYYARPYLEKVWNTAANLGFSNHFIYVQYGGIEDDHAYINKNAGIPTIDIIHYDVKTESFPEHHHTHRDNMNVIDKNTLKAVGQTLLEVIYTEK